MATNHITVDRNSAQGNELLNIVEQIRLYQDKLRQHKEMMDAQVDTGPDYSAIETQYGLVTGKGVSVYNLVAGSSAELAADSNLVSLIDYVVPL